MAGVNTNTIAIEINPINYLINGEFSFNDIITKLNNGNVAAIIESINNGVTIAYLEGLASDLTGSYSYIAQFTDDQVFGANDPDEPMVILDGSQDDSHSQVS